MKTIRDEDDLTLLREIDYNIVPSHRELLTLTFLIVLYYSGYGRMVFWIVCFSIIFISTIYFLESIHHKTKHSIVREELTRRKII